jgi:hypothetical protein
LIVPPRTGSRSSTVGLRSEANAGPARHCSPYDARRRATLHDLRAGSSAAGTHDAHDEGGK